MKAHALLLLLVPLKTADALLPSFPRCRSVAQRSSDVLVTPVFGGIGLGNGCRKCDSALHAEYGSEEGDRLPKLSAPVSSIVTLYRRTSWLSWWGQIILTVVSGVILTFANTVRKGGNANTYALWSSGFAFSSLGAASAFLNAVWTWNMTRMSRRIALRKIEEGRIVPTLKRLSQISVMISLVGMAVTLFAAEQIVGTLASKVLSSQGLVPTLAIGTQLNQIQALDIFLVQANTNILVAHYIPLGAYIWLQSQLPQAVAGLVGGVPLPKREK